MVAPVSDSRGEFMLIVFREDRESQADGTFEADYLYELEEKSTIASDLKALVDCAAGLMSASFKLVEFWQVG